jgi:hypothetical protein
MTAKMKKLPEQRSTLNAQRSTLNAQRADSFAFSHFILSYKIFHRFR